MTDASISIALATYNGGRYLNDQLESFLAQTRVPDELVVCDDDSTDDTLVLLEEFARRAPFPVRIHRNSTRLGPKGNFNRVIELCSGDLIALSDQDDVWLPPKIERIAEIFAADPSTLVIIHDLALVDSTLRRTGATQLRRTDRLRMPRTTHVTGSATAFRSDLIRLLLPFPSPIRTYDAWIHAVGLALGARVVIEDVLSLYRRHPETSTDAVAASWTLRRLLRATRKTLGRASDIANGERLGWLAELEERLGDLDEDDRSSLGGAYHDEPARFINRQRWAVEVRQSVVRSPWHQRPFRIARATRQGVYEEFAGPGSAVRDLFTFQLGSDEQEGRRVQYGERSCQEAE